MNRILGVHLTNKIHIIISHFGQYIELTGRAIGHASDQTVEAAHAAMNRRMRDSKYWVKNVESKIHGKKMHRCILHFNSYNI